VDRRKVRDDENKYLRDLQECSIQDKDLVGYAKKRCNQRQGQEGRERFDLLGVERLLERMSGIRTTIRFLDAGSSDVTCAGWGKRQVRRAVVRRKKEKRSTHSNH